MRTTCRSASKHGKSQQLDVRLLNGAFVRIAVVIQVRENVMIDAMLEIPLSKVGKIERLSKKLTKPGFCFCFCVVKLFGFRVDERCLHVCGTQEIHLPRRESRLVTRPSTATPFLTTDV